MMSFSHNWSISSTLGENRNDKIKESSKQIDSKNNKRYIMLVNTSRNDRREFDKHESKD